VLAAIAALMSDLKADSSRLSPSWMSIARLTFPSRLELKSLAGSFNEAPFATIVGLPASQKPHGISYLVNAISPNDDGNVPLTELGVASPQDLFAYDDEDPNWGTAPPQIVTNASINYPSTLVAMIDARVAWAHYFDGATTPTSNNEVDPWGDSGDFGDGGPEAGWGITLTNDVYYMATDGIFHPNFPDAPGMIKHTGHTNVMFSDGHVKAWAPTQFLNLNGQLDPKNWLVNAP